MTETIVASSGPVGGPDPSSSERPVPDVQFTGLRMPLFKLALKNLLFTLATFGIYRFWAKTRIRQYFWRNIQFHGQALEYAGKPSELLIGFLIALAVLVPIFAVYKGIGFVMQGSSNVTLMLLNIAYIATLLAFFQFAFYRMWRYRLSRTVWQGIHFGLDGSPWKYAALRLGGLVLTFLTLGIAYPWYRVAIWRFRARHTRYGDQHFAFAGSGADLLMPWLGAATLPIVVLIIWLGSIVSGMIDSAAMATDEVSGLLSFQAESRLGGLFYLIAILTVIASPVLNIWYRVREAEYLINATTFKNASFYAPLRFRPIIGSVLRWLASLFLLSVLPMILVGSVSISTIMLSHDMTAGMSMIFWIIGLSVIVVTMVPVLSMTILNYDFTRHVCAVLQIQNIEVFDDVARSTRPGPSYGEGFADALDVGAF